MFLTKIRDEIKDTLDKRQELIDSTGRYNWFSQKKPWMRVTSMAKLEADSDIRKKWILYGGLGIDGLLRTNYNNLYNISDESYKYTKFDESVKGSLKESFGLINRPIPGITELSVEHKGSYGSIKEATLSLKCWDLNQLSMLEKLYMTFGVSVLIEWGWNVNINNNSSIINPFKDKEPGPSYELFKEILKYAKKSNGHYDAMQGMISDFNWNMAEDGSFDSNITITSIGETMLERDINSTSKNKTIRTHDDSNDDSKLLEKNIIANLEYFSENLDENGIFKIDNKVYGQRINFVTRNTRKDKIAQEVDDIRDRVSGANIKKEHDFVTWEFIERYLLNRGLSNVYENTRSRSSIEEQFVPRFSSDDYINYRPQILCADPDIAVFPSAKINFEVAKDTSLLKVTKGKKGYSKSYNDFFSNTPINNSLKEKFFNEDGTKIKLNKILFNWKAIYEISQESNTISDFVYKLFNGLSENCGDLWDFALFIDEDSPEVIKVIDLNTIEENGEIDKPFVFKLYSKNSIIKGFELNTEVDQELKTLFLNSVNSDKDQSNESTMGYGLKMFNINVSDLAYGKKIEHVDKNLDKNLNDKLELSPLTRLNEVYANCFPQGDKKIKWVRSLESVRKIKMALKNYIDNESQDVNNKTFDDKKYVALPLKLSFTIDGISGLKHFNMVDIDYKPERYRKSIFFHITDVSHKITANEWTTTINTIMRINDLESIK